MTAAAVIELHAIGNETLSGEGSALELGPDSSVGARRTAAALTIDVVALDSAVTIIVESAAADDGTWIESDRIAIDSLGTLDLFVAGLRPFVRVRWELESPDEAEFSVTGEAQVVYCNPADMTRFGVPEAAIQEMALSDRVAACISATDIAASYIGAGFCLPLKSWDWSIRTNTARLAVHTLFSARGFDPESADGSVSAGADRAEKWFTLVAKGIVVPGAVVDGTNPPTGLVDQTPEESEFGFASVSDPLRGW